MSDRVKAASVDRRAVQSMTVREVCDKLVRANEGDRLTADASAELDYAMDLMEALDEELRELRGRQVGESVAARSGKTLYRKTALIEAHQWFKNGDHPNDGVGEDRLDQFSGETYQGLEGNVVRYYRHPDVAGETTCKHCTVPMHYHGWIDTLEGGHIVCPGDWIATGQEVGENWPIKPDRFEATYEVVPS